MTFENVLQILNDFTAPPEDRDYDRHVQDAMFAVYNLMNLQHRTNCPHCGTKEFLCGYNGVGCTSDKAVAGVGRGAVRYANDFEVEK